MQVSDLAKAYHELLKGPSGKAGREYLRTRGINLDTSIDQFLLGYSHVGYFAHRVTFPITDMSYRIEMISSRAIGARVKIKHKHSAGIKMQWLYNEPALAQESDYIVLCESPIDVITLMQEGILAVGAMGANNMNKGKVMKLGHFKRVYICFDNDINESGQKAAKRVGEMCDTHNDQKVYNIHIPFILGSDVNSMYLAEPGQFKQLFKEIMLIGEGSRIMAPIREPRTAYKGPLVGKYPIMDTIERHVDNLTPCGAGRYKAICPFHDEEEPSFHIDEMNNRFKCFGCGRSGDTIDFLMFIHQRMGKNLGFKDALAILDQVPQ